VLNTFTPQTLRGLMAGETRDDLVALAAHVESEEMRPSIGRTVALAEAAQALHALGDGHGRGKSVVRVVPGAD
jgi:NADPH:quinone reductase-like Zn-dependent oxidoreductase